MPRRRPRPRCARRRGAAPCSTRLFERLPGVAAADRQALALRWLERGRASRRQAREEIADAACSMIADPAFAELFGPNALAEAPIAATLADGRVVAGTVDGCASARTWSG